MVPHREQSQQSCISEYELRSTRLAPGQLTRLCLASHRRGGPFIISRMPRLCSARNRKTRLFSLESSHESAQTQLDHLSLLRKFSLSEWVSEKQAVTDARRELGLYLTTQSYVRETHTEALAVTPSYTPETSGVLIRFSLFHASTKGYLLETRWIYRFITAWIFSIFGDITFQQHFQAVAHS